MPWLFFMFIAYGISIQSEHQQEHHPEDMLT
jgi:hypothetical protein